MFVMQRAPLSIIVWLPILVALYACASTVPHTPGNAKPVVVAAEKIEKPAVPAVVAAESKPPELPLRGSMAIMPVEVETGALPPLAADDGERLPLVQGDEAPAPHIALLLPLKSAASGAAAEVVQQGFMAAANVEAQGLSGELLVRVYGSVDESNDIVALYRQANASGPQAHLARRLQFAFEEAWQDLGGTILRQIEFNNDPAVLADITGLPDTMIFLAADAEKARLIRPYLLNQMPIYATSRIFLGNNETLINYDLNGVRFVDMPWLLQADHPAVMVYPRADPPLPVDHERFYALGIDAFRLIRLLLANRADAKL